ncbi:helix-turn-helix domain-containing protein [Actinomadura macrotermitis]|uniref:HTH cro/C1-type domain-containing protein n=1 Tax=Actinomadura macrotermitis TaxID=2585200 RepID=A0A7K0BU75_9ACTN|nr:helix-turn-helix transcriptional regulator [Actinomadura macrotermitis]MQY04753.1 hypothetical protein [Actinomadura macrotermitis]
MATVRHRRLARELRILRERCGLRSEAVALELGWDRSKVSRLETARVKPKLADITELLDLYGVTSPERDALIQLAKDARQRGWWRAFGDVFEGTYIGLESEADSIRSWQPQVVPGLLQTEDYARAILTAACPDTLERTEQRVRARMARKPLLNRPGRPPSFHAIVDEAVLRHMVGGRDVLRAQLSELWAASQRPNITLQVMPFEAGAHPGVDGAFVILGYLEDLDPDVVYVEGQAGSVFPESTEEVTRFRLIWERLVDAALSPADSAALLVELTRE